MPTAARRCTRIALAALLATLTLPMAAGAQASFAFSGATTGWQLVNSGMDTEVVPVTITTAGALAAITVTSAGTTNLDYAATGATVLNPCTPTTNYNVGDICNVSVRFQPKSPGIRRGAVVLTSTNAVLSTKPLFGIGQGPMAVFTPATIGTVAGDGQWLYIRDGNAATDEPIFLPQGVAVDTTGNIYISDSGNDRIRMVDTSGNIHTVAGNGSPGFENDGAMATTAAISNPSGLLLDGAGNLFIADSGNHAVRELVAATGKLITVAGTLGGNPGSDGDNGLATAATLGAPQGLALDANNNLYISDSQFHVVRKVDAITGFITTFAGTSGTGSFSGDTGLATSATLNTPWGLAVDVKGNVYIADLQNGRVRMVANGTITTFAGNGTPTWLGNGFTATNNGLYQPAGVLVDPAGNIYIADSGADLVLKVNAKTQGISVVGGVIDDTTFEGDGGPANIAGIYGPYAMAMDMKGNLLIADIFHHRVREIFATNATLKYAAIHVGRSSPPQSQIVENDGNDVLDWTAITSPDLNSTWDAPSTTCTPTTGTTAVDETCLIGAVFQPQTVGTNVTSTLSAASNASNSTSNIILSGESDALDPTVTKVATSLTPAAFGTNVTFTATVTGEGNPTETVRFLDGTNVIGTGTLSSGIATFTTNTLAIGTHPITAQYTGDAANSPSTSTNTVSQVIQQKPTVTLVSTLNPSKVGQTIPLTVTVMGSQVIPTGLVQLKDGSTLVATTTLDQNGDASFNNISTLAAGPHSLTASYQGDPSTMAATSAVVSQAVNRWATSTTVTTSAPTGIEIGESVTFTITVAPTSSVPATGTVTLKDGTNTLATLSLSNNMATYAISTLSVATHPITATYNFTTNDGTNDTSTSTPALNQQITQIGTATTLSSSANPANGGATIAFTATVTPDTTNSVAGVLSGTVTLKEGSTVLGTGAVSPNGVVTINVSNLSVNTHNIIATYGGITNYAGSSSQVFSQQVQLATTSIQVSSSLNPSIVGNSVTLTALVSGNGGIPTGMVTIKDGTTVLGTPTLNSSGQGSVTVTNLVSGVHNIVASYAGDIKNNPSSPQSFTQTVNQATTGLTLASSANPAFAGTTITFTATITSNGSLPVGSATLTDSGATIATAPISNTGSATFTLSTLTAGTHQLVANFAGDTDHKASASAPALAQMINTGTSQVALASSANPNVFGSSVTITATVTATGAKPMGNVLFTEGATTLSTAPVNSSGIASYTNLNFAIGQHVITAVYQGDQVHAASPAQMLTQNTVQSTQTTLLSNPNPSIFGSNVALTATVIGKNNIAPVGTVTFSEGATTLGTASVTGAGLATLNITTLTTGTHMIVATYGGDPQSQTSQSSPLTQNVNAADTTVTIVSNRNPATVGTSISFTATVVSEGKAAMGDIQFFDGATLLATIGATNSSATYSTTALSAGPHSILARYGGDNGTQSSGSNVIAQVVQEPTQTGIRSATNPALTAQNIVLTATIQNGVNASGTVTFEDNGVSLGTAPVSNGVATLNVTALSAGTHTLSALYGGDTFNLPSTSNGLGENVSLRTSTTGMTVSSPSYLLGQQITLVAVVHTDGPVAPTGTVTFTSNGVTLGSSSVASAGAATFIFSPSATSYNIVAAYNGDAVYSPSTATAFQIAEGNSSTFSLASDPSQVSLTSGAHQTLNLTMVSSTTFSDTLSLACLDLPQDATCTFSKNEMALNAGSTDTLSVVFDTGNPLGSGAKTSMVTGTSRVTTAGFMLPAAALLGLLLFISRRNRKLNALLALALLVLAGFGTTGCGNHLDVATTPAGQYNVRIIAQGSQSGVNQIATIAVTVK